MAGVSDSTKYPQFPGLPPKIYDWTNGRLFKQNTRRIAYLDSLENPRLDARSAPHPSEVAAYRIFCKFTISRKSG